MLLPGLIRSYAHGQHWVAFALAHADTYDVRFFVCAWAIRGAAANHFAQRADRQAGLRVDEDEVARSFPPQMTTVQLVGLEHWRDTDGAGYDGRFYNQWMMVQRHAHS